MATKPLVLLVAFVASGLAPASAAAQPGSRAGLPQIMRQRMQPASIERGLVILTEFPDVRHDVQRSFVEDRFWSRLDGYVRSMSYQRVSIAGDVTARWHALPDPVARYRISSRNLEVDRSRIRKLIDDTLDTVDREVDFSKYSFTVIFLGATLSEYGMIGLCGYPGMLGWGAEGVLKTRSGQYVRGGIAIFSYQAHLGTLFHDVAHVLGGVENGKRRVPCLYDHDLQAKAGDIRKTFEDATINMGFWDPMSCHYYKRDLPPPGISSWTRLRLGWLDPAKVRIVNRAERAEVLLDPLEDGSGRTLAVKIPLSGSTYYLIENRQPMGFDRNLPGSGILIMYADDDVAECRHGQSPVKLADANPGMPHLEGAAFDVGRNDAFQDRKRGIAIQLLEKTGGSYRIRIGPPEG